MHNSGTEVTGTGVSTVRPKARRQANNWTAKRSSIQDSFTNFGGTLKRELLKKLCTSIQLPAAACPAPGSRCSQQHNVEKTTMTIRAVTPGSQLSLAGPFLANWTNNVDSCTQTSPASRGPLLAGNGVRQQHQRTRNPAQLNAVGRPRLVVGSSFSQPPKLSPFDILSPLSPWPPPPAAADCTPALPPLPDSLIGRVDKDLAPTTS